MNKDEAASHVGYVENSTLKNPKEFQSKWKKFEYFVLPTYKKSPVHACIN